MSLSEWLEQCEQNVDQSWGKKQRKTALPKDGLSPVNYY